MTSPSGSRLLTPPGESGQDRVETPRRRPRATSRAWLRRGWITSCLALTIGGASGCNMMSNAYQQLRQHEALDEFMVHHRNRVMAARAWYRQKRCFDGHHHHDELKEGFIDGYMAVAEGGDGCLPAIAPRKYWGWQYQSADGQRAVNAWFAAYPHGAKAAEQHGIGHWSEIRPVGAVHSTPAHPGPSGGDVEIVPTPFVEQEGTLPAPPDPSASTGSVLDAPAQAETPQGGGSRTEQVEAPSGPGRGDAAPDLASSFGAAKPSTSADTSRGSAAPDAPAAQLDDALNAPSQAQADAEFLEVFGDPAPAASGTKSEPNAELPFTFD